MGWCCVLFELESERVDETRFTTKPSWRGEEHCTTHCKPFWRLWFYQFARASPDVLSNGWTGHTELSARVFPYMNLWQKVANRKPRSACFGARSYCADGMNNRTLKCLLDVISQCSEWCWLLRSYWPYGALLAGQPQVNMCIGIRYIKGWWKVRTLSTHSDYCARLRACSYEPGGWPCWSSHYFYCKNADVFIWEPGSYEQALRLRSYRQYSAPLAGQPQANLFIAAQ